jgi:acetyl-CoA carboxylase biotin carboxyl carrier protein
MDLTNEDVADVLALLDSLPYDELDLQTPRFRLTLRRTPDGWTREDRRGPQGPSSGPGGTQGPINDGGGGEGRVQESSAGAGETGEIGEVERARGARETRGAGDTKGAGGTRGAGDTGEAGDQGGLVAVRAPLPGTFYRAPRPGAAPFVEVGSRVSADTVVGIVETMKLMNSVPAGTEGTVAEICVGNAEPTVQGATLMRIRADR